MKHKKKLISVVAFLIAIGFAYLNFYVANSTKNTVEVVVLKANTTAGTKVEETMLTTKEVGNFNVGSETIKTKEDILGKYLTRDIKASRLIYTDDFSSENEDRGFEQIILNQAVAIHTSLVESVAAELKEDSIIQLALVKENEENREITIEYPEELKRVRVLKIVMDTGVPINEEKKEEQAIQDETKRPAVLVLDLTNEQTKKILPYSYSGNIHCILLNESEAQQYRDKIGI